MPDGLVKSVVVGGCASCAASVFTNPLEVAKSRFQIQGELGATARPYRHVLQTLAHIAKHEGPFALQKGLVAAWGYQFVGNGIRLGCFEHIKAALGGGSSFGMGLVSGASAGVVASVFAQPFYLVKVRMQVLSSQQGAIGEQHAYTSVRDAFRSIATGPRGFFGLWQGLDGCILRSVAASSVQMATYNTAKAKISKDVTGGSAVLDTLLASLTAGLVITTVMEPFDVAATRMCNQGDAGTKYRHAFHCIQRTFQVEGTWGLYKGWMTNYVRMGPHTVLMFTFWEQCKKLADGLSI